MRAASASATSLCAVASGRLQPSAFVAEFVGFLALRAEQEHPEGDGERDDDQDRDDRAGVEALDLHLIRLPGGFGGASARFFGAVGRDRRGVEGGDDLELGDEVAGLAAARRPTPAGVAVADARASPLRRRVSSIRTPTRVTPSMSLSAETKPATASWPLAQPTISSAGPGDAGAQGDAGGAVDGDLGLDGAGQVGQPDVARAGSGRVRASPVPSRSGCRRGW